MEIPVELLTRTILTARYYSYYLKLLTESQATSVVEQSVSSKSDKPPSKKRKAEFSTKASSEQTKKVMHGRGGNRSASVTNESIRDVPLEYEHISQKEDEMIE